MSDCWASEILRAVGALVFERGWLSSNNVLFTPTPSAPATVVDTGYATHSAMTLALLRNTLGTSALQRIVNTHLHSDHCGGNAALQAQWGCEAWVPAASFDTVQRWDQTALTYADTGQYCPRFTAHASISPGSTVRLGHLEWEIHGAPGHDPDAVVLFQRQHGVLISGDALWEHGVAIIFPELQGQPGFNAAMQALDAIETLRPTLVIPGHGAPFTSVAAALARSRERLEAFAASPAKHDGYAMRALIMFHMLEHQTARRAELEDWVRRSPLLKRGESGTIYEARIAESLARLLRDGSLVLHGDNLSVAGIT